MKVLRQELKKLDHIQKGKWLKKLLEQEGFDVRSYKVLLHKVTRLHKHKDGKIKNLKKDEENL
tara:strand:- start:13 stop:201 length:189 start_codon:yes stop_codon:yes gene_type:complete